MITHFARPGVYETERQALAVFLEHVVPALLPCCCPLFPRSRWFGADQTLDYVGRLAAIHALWEPLMSLWCKRGGGKDAQDDELLLPIEASESLGQSLGEAAFADGWDAFIPAAKQPRHEDNDDVEASNSGAGAGPAPALQDLGLSSCENSGPSMPPAAADPAGFNWYEYNEKLKTTVADWVFAKHPGACPMTMVALMRQYMAPILRLMSFYLYVSSHKFSKDQMQTSCSDSRQKYRMLIAYDGKEVCELFEATKACLLRKPVAIANEDRNQDVNVLCFTMLSRLMCASAQLLQFRHRKYPYKLFSALHGVSEAKAVFHDPDCLKDEVALRLCQDFNTEDAFLGVECMDIIKSLGCLMQTDIAAIERGHTLGRKINQTRNQLGPGIQLKTMVGDWMLRKAAQLKADALSYLYFDGPAALGKFNRFCQKMKQGEAKASRKRRRRKRGGGGSWRAFVSTKCKGTKCTKRILKDLAVRYRALSPEQLAYYREVGRIATISHRKGMKAFGGSFKRAQPRLQQMALDAGSSTQPFSDHTFGGFELASASADLRIAPFNPHEALAKSLKTISKTVRSAYKTANMDREHVTQHVSSFLTGSDGSAAAANASPLLEERQTELSRLQTPPYLEGTCRPRPATVPWVEWTPPVDVLTQAWFHDMQLNSSYLPFAIVLSF